MEDALKRPTRSMWELKQAQPVKSEIAKAEVVDVNTNEALALLADSAVIIRTGRVADRRCEVYWHGGKNHLWIAGYTSSSPNDDYPSLIHERSEAESNNPTHA